MALTPNTSNKRETVCIFGTGDFGRALGHKLIQSGYPVVYGSRSTQISNLIPKDAEVLSHAEAAQKAAVIIIAVQRQHYNFLIPLAENLHGKVLVDISNNLKLNQYPESNAEYLAQLLPGSRVVKAFNTVSAWALQSGTLDASRQVRLSNGDFLCHRATYLMVSYQLHETRLGHQNQAGLRWYFLYNLPFQTKCELKFTSGF